MISIHALREEGDSVLSLNFDFFDISIHALREEGDPSSAVRFWLQKVFLSTPSARRATPDSRRAERGLAHFYPRPPRGGRPARREPLKGAANISIHALREEGDLNELPDGNKEEISIHALREEGDGRASSLPTLVVNFYPRPPRGGRPPVGTRKAACHELFLSTPSARRTTVSVSPEAAVLPNFYPRPPRGGRLPPC